MFIDADYNSNGFSLGNSIGINHIGSRLCPVVRCVTSPDSDTSGDSQLAVPVLAALAGVVVLSKRLVSVW
jgi:hypothetical protein